MGFGDVYTALQSNIIDGAENNEMALTDNGHGDVCKYYSYDMHQMVPDILIGNNAFIESLTEEEKAIFEEGYLLVNQVEREEWVKAVEAQRTRRPMSSMWNLFIRIRFPLWKPVRRFTSLCFRKTRLCSQSMTQFRFIMKSIRLRQNRREP